LIIIFLVGFVINIIPTLPTESATPQLIAHLKVSESYTLG